MGDMDMRSLIKEARENVEAEEKKEGKKTSVVDGIIKADKAADIWTPTNVFRFSLAGLLTIVKLGLTPSVALVNVSWLIVLLPAYILEGVMVAALIAGGILTVLYLAIMALWAALEILVIDPIQRKRLKKKIDEATHTGNPRGDMLAEIHAAMVERDKDGSH